jgi:hypothetical protein
MKVIAFCKETVKVEVTSAYVINIAYKPPGTSDQIFYFGNAG